MKSSQAERILQKAGEVLEKIASALECESSDPNVDVGELRVSLSLLLGVLPLTHI